MGTFLGPDGRELTPMLDCLKFCVKEQVPGNTAGMVSLQGVWGKRGQRIYSLHLPVGLSQVAESTQCCTLLIQLCLPHTGGMKDISASTQAKFSSQGFLEQIATLRFIKDTPSGCTKAPESPFVMLLASKEQAGRQSHFSVQGCVPLVHLSLCSF